MKPTEIQKKGAKEVFDANPKLNKVHATSDGQCFPDENAAYSHQRDLGKKAEDVHEFIRDDEGDKSATGEAGDTKEIDLNSMSKAELIAFAESKEFPAEEFNKLNKENLLAYLKDKTAAA